ncbi:hypothetical protein BDV97DRAFT_395111 [Delphinella strobiligena]|nr:hypothetical protein BDV97DRAFT_395111 [Delphinella strobiligena]
MSGLEVVGLVLGVLPLFISALEHYEKGLGQFKSMFSYRTQLARYRCKLMVEYATYSQTVEYLLISITDEDKFEDMVSRGFSEVWKDPTLAIRLQEHLGNVHEAYKFTLTEMRSVIEELATLLDIERKGLLAASHLEALLVAHPPKASLGRDTQTFFHLYDFKTRLKFSLKSWKVNPVLEELEKHNNTLHRYTETSTRLKKAKGRKRTGGKQSSAFALRLQQVRDSVRRLYSTLENVWTCIRHASHSASLKLDARLVLSLTRGPRSDRFEANICFSICSPVLSSSGGWQELDIHVLSDSSVPTTSRSRVGFVLPDDPVTNIDLAKLASVRCLCTVLEDAEVTRENLQLCLDHNDKLLCEDLASLNSQAPAKSRFTSMITLGELLATQNASNGMSRRRVFNRKQLYTVALHLASSLLQLYSTPFLNGGWCARNILFPRSEALPQLTHVEIPCISRNFPSAETSQASQTKHDHRTLLSLGILLLELFFREPFSEHREAAGEKSDQGYTDLGDAMRLVKEDKEEMSNGFYQAVSYCITSFSDFDVDLANAAFREKVVDNVIMPLSDELLMMGT